jgi:hypothetical protein
VRPSRAQAPQRPVWTCLKLALQVHCWLTLPWPNPGTESAGPAPACRRALASGRCWLTLPWPNPGTESAGPAPACRRALASGPHSEYHCCSVLPLGAAGPCSGWHPGTSRWSPRPRHESRFAASPQSRKKPGAQAGGKLQVRAKRQGQAASRGLPFSFF